MVLVEASEEKHEVLWSLCLVHDAGGWPSDASSTHRSQGGMESSIYGQVPSQAPGTPSDVGGQKLMLIGFSVGLSWGARMLEWQSIPRT